MMNKEHINARLEQLNGLILQYQDLLFIQEQKLLIAGLRSRAQREAQAEIERLNSQIEKYREEVVKLSRMLGQLDSAGQASTLMYFQEEFVSNQNAWGLGKGSDHLIKIDNHSLNFEVNNDKGKVMWYSGRQLKIPILKPVSFEVCFKQYHGPKDEGYGFLIARERGAYIEFVLRDNDHFRIDQVVDSKREDLLLWSHSTMVNQFDNWNIIRAEFEGKQLRFFINQVMVIQMVVPNMFEEINNLGFVVYGSQNIEVQKLSIFQGRAH